MPEQIAGTDGDDGWRMWHGRLCRTCQCSDWDDDAKLPIRPGEQHVRERVSGAPVELCYFADETTKTVTVLYIRTME